MCVPGSVLRSRHRDHSSIHREPPEVGRILLEIDSSNLMIWMLSLPSAKGRFHCRCIYLSNKGAHNQSCINIYITLQMYIFIQQKLSTLKRNTGRRHNNHIWCLMKCDILAIMFSCSLSITRKLEFIRLSKTYISLLTCFTYINYYI